VEGASKQVLLLILFPYLERPGLLWRHRSDDRTGSLAVVLEAVSGTLYVAVLIARVVGLYAATGTERRAEIEYEQICGQASEGKE
jgi:hypothetical protein